MSDFKKKRIVDQKLLRSYHGKPCLVCGAPGVPHHIKTKGSGGDDIAENLVALCIKHHNQIHELGAKKFLEKYGLDLSTDRET